MFIKAAIILISYLQIGSSIRCYECNSMNNSMCVDPSLYDQETLRNFMRSTECNRGVQAIAPEGSYDFFCRKIVQYILHKHYAAELRVTRGCGWRRSPKDCYKADNPDHLETVCQCFSDDCNAAATATSCFWTAAVLLAARSIF